MQWMLAVTSGLARSNIMGAVAMLSLMLAMTPSAQAEGSWCAHKSGTGGSNCGFLPVLMLTTDDLQPRGERVC
jgi:hypothetical protein